MSYRFIAALAALAALALTSGCATVTGSTAQSINVDTRTQAQESVAGASCRLTNSKGTWFLTSPGTATITRSNDALNITCDKEGHASGSVVAESATRPAMWGNAIAGGVIGAAIDHSSGAAYEYPASIRVLMGQTLKADAPAVWSGPGNDPAISAKTSSAPSAALRDVHAVPFLTETGKDGYEKFLAAHRRPRAFVISERGHWSWRSGPNAVADSVRSCEDRAKAKCYVYAVDDAVVYDGPRAHNEAALLR
jgi:hypothetical protein